VDELIELICDAVAEVFPGKPSRPFVALRTRVLAEFKFECAIRFEDQTIAGGTGRTAEEAVLATAKTWVNSIKRQSALERLRVHLAEPAKAALKRKLNLDDDRNAPDPNADADIDTAFDSPF